MKEHVQVRVSFIGKCSTLNEMSGEKTTCILYEEKGKSRSRRGAKICSILKITKRDRMTTRDRQTTQWELQFKQQRQQKLSVSGGTNDFPKKKHKGMSDLETKSKICYK